MWVIRGLHGWFLVVVLGWVDRARAGVEPKTLDCTHQPRQHLEGLSIELPINLNIHQL